MKRFAFCGSLLAFVSLASVAAATTFFSGTIGVDGTVAGGTNVPAANIAQGGGGTAYNNAWTGASPGLVPGTPAKLSATGFFPITAARTGVTNFSLNTGNRLVAVYAFEGTATLNAPGFPPGTAVGEFDPSVSVPGGSFADGTAHGIVNIYNFGAVNPGLSDVDPTTWVPGAGTFLENINNSANIVAQLRITDRATGDGGPAYRLGPPGAPTTVLPLVINPGAVNSLPQDVTGAVVEIRGDLKLVFNPNLLGSAGDLLNLLFNDPFAQPDFDGDLVVNDPSPIDANAQQQQVRRPSDGALVDAFDLFSNIDQLFFQPGATPTPSPADIANLNLLFDALLDMPFADDLLNAIGNHLFSNQAAANGDSFTAGNLNLLSGDFTNRNQSIQGIPGAQFTPVIEPEPATVAIWIIVGLIGLAAANKLQRPKVAVT